MKALLLARDQLVKMKRRLYGEIRGVLRPFGIRLPARAGTKRFDAAARAACSEDDVLYGCVHALLAALGAIEAQLAALEERVWILTRSDATAWRLMSVPGVGPVTALAFQAAIEDPDRFRRSRDVGAYLGLTPRRYPSGERNVTGPISRQGDAMARHDLHEAANGLLIPTVMVNDRWYGWVERFNADGPAGLIGRKPPGNRPKLDDAQRAALLRVVESGPNPVRDGVVRWRLIDLAAWVWDKFGISVSAATLSRELNALGFGKRSARPRHYAQNAEDIAAFKKTSPSGWRKSARRFRRAPQESCGSRSSPWKAAVAIVAGTDGAIDGNSEAHGGRQDRPEEHDHPPLGAARHTTFGAARPAHAVGLYFRSHLPEGGQGRGSGHAMLRHPCHDRPLAEISAMVDPGAQAVVILDQAGWHMSRALAVPQTITLLALPPRPPELNPVENIWQYLRENWLSNRVFESYDDIVTLACEAWNRLMDRPSRIMTIGLREWAHGF